MEELSEAEEHLPKFQSMDLILMASFDCGGKIYSHHKVDRFADDYRIVEEIAYDKASIGCEVLILPELPEGDALRTLFFTGAKERKCPDLKIDGQFVEIKTPAKKLSDTKISTNIKRGHEQANHVIINLVEHYSSGKLYKIVKGRFKTHVNLEIVEFRMSGKYYRFESGKVLKKLR